MFHHIEFVQYGNRVCTIWATGRSAQEASPIRYRCKPMLFVPAIFPKLVRQIPEGITFKESQTLTGGDKVTVVDTGVTILNPNCNYNIAHTSLDFGKIGLGALLSILPLGLS